MGAAYALCLQKAFDTSAPYYIDQALDFGTALEVITSDAATTAALLAAYAIWVSLSFLYNGQLSMMLQAHKTDRFARLYMPLAVTFGGFYIFATTIGPPDSSQLTAILLVNVLDLTYPIVLAGLLRPRSVAWWIVRDVCQILLVVAMIVAMPREWVVAAYSPYILLSLLAAQLLASRIELKTQLQPTKWGVR